ncbi:MAG: YHYH protein, partial [Pseudomonadota bacterium]
AVFGKWHVAGGNPDVNHPSSLDVGYYAGNLTGNLSDYSEWQVTINGAQSTSTQYHTSAIVDYAIDWISSQDKPWFTWVAFSAPHSPWHSPPVQFNQRNLSGTTDDIDANRRDYYLAAIETLDTELGRLLDSLSDEERDNTIVMIIGDNGTPAPVIDTSAYTRSHSKGSLFQGGVHVPLVISGAGVERSGARENALVSIVDFYPTIASLAGSTESVNRDGISLVQSFTNTNALDREYLYTEYVSDRALGSGWTVRSDRYKYIAYTDGSQALYDLLTDPDELVNLLPASADIQATYDALRQYGLEVRGEVEDTESPETPLDITDEVLGDNGRSCADHMRGYFATATDAATGSSYEGNLSVSVNDTHCVFTTNITPNHTFNDGADPFPNAFSTQAAEYQVPLIPAQAGSSTALSLSYDDAILLNGVKVDLLAAGCFGVGNGKVGCNDDSQPWRYDPMFASNGFRVDSHNAHTQPDGAYHYHGDPVALFDRSGTVVSPVVGFAADGFPIYGSYIEANGSVRKVQSSFQLKSGTRPVDNNQPGGSYDGSYRDDYEYVDGSGDLDECNGMMVDGSYGYYVTDSYPYVVACFKGSVDESFSK